MASVTPRVNKDVAMSTEDLTVYMIRGVRDVARFDWITFPPHSPVGHVPCHECGGSGWWGFGPVEEVNGPCVVCKGTGHEYVGLI